MIKWENTKGRGRVRAFSIMASFGKVKLTRNMMLTVE